MATDLTTYLGKLSAGSPKISAWFNSDKYKILTDFGATTNRSQPMDGLEIQGSESSKIGLLAPFNGFVQFAVARQHKLTYEVAQEAKREEILFDPTLNGLKHLDGKPFCPQKNNKNGYVMLFTCFPQAFVRLQWLFKSLDGGKDSKGNLTRLAPYRMAVVFYDKRNFETAIRDALNKHLSSTLAGQVINYAVTALKAVNVLPSAFQYESPKVNLGNLEDNPKRVDLTPLYYAVTGTMLMETDQPFELYFFDEYGWPLDPVYIWHAFEQLSANYTGIQQGYQAVSGSGSASDPLKDRSLSSKLSGTNKKRVMIHLVNPHGNQPEPYVRRAFKLEGSKYELDTVSTSAAPPVLRKVTPKSGTTSSDKLKFKLEFPNPSTTTTATSNKPEGAYGIAPGGVMSESAIEQTVLDYDFMRLVLIDQVHHIPRNKPDNTSTSSSQPYQSNATLRPYKKETQLTHLLDGQTTLDQIKKLIDSTSGSSITERRIAWMTPQIDPFLKLDGKHSGRYKDVTISATADSESNKIIWNSQHQTNLEKFKDHIVVQTARGADGGVRQILLGKKDSFPVGSHLRMYPAEYNLETGSATRGNGTCTTVLKDGSFLLPLPHKTGKPYRELLFDLLVVAWDDKGKLINRFMPGIKIEGLKLELEDPQGKLFDFTEVALLGESDLKKSSLVFNPKCSKDKRHVLLVNPNSGATLNTLTPGPQVGGSGVGSTQTMALYTTSGNTTTPWLDGDETIYLGICEKSDALIDECKLWQAYRFSSSLKASGNIPLYSNDLLEKLLAFNKASNSKQLILASSQPSGNSPNPAGEDALETYQSNQKLLTNKLGEKFVSDTHVYWTLERAESALYVYTKDGNNQRQSALLTGVPLMQTQIDHKDINFGNPHAETGRDTANINLAINGRGSHLIYDAFRNRMTSNYKDQLTKTFDPNDNHAEAQPPDQAVKESTHRMALLETRAPNLDLKNPSASILDRPVRTDQLNALAEAIQCAQQSIYIQGPLFELFYRDTRTQTGALRYSTGEIRLIQLIHDQMLRNPNLLVILCIPREIHHLWGQAVEGSRYVARKQAVRTLLFDGYEDKFKKAQVMDQPVGAAELPRLFSAAKQVHDRVAVFHPLGFMGRPMDLITNIVIVDDCWVSLGNAGFSRRSLTFDGGLNAAYSDLSLQDNTPKLVRQLRTDLMKLTLRLDDSDAARLWHFPDAFQTITELNHRRLSRYSMPFDENWSHLKPEHLIMQWNDVIDPDGRKVLVSLEALMTFLSPLLSSLRSGAENTCPIEVRWNVPAVFIDKATDYQIQYCRKNGQVIARTIQLTAKSGNPCTIVLEFLTKAEPYWMRVRCNDPQGQCYEGKGSIMISNMAVSQISLDIGMLQLQRSLNVRWKVPADLQIAAYECKVYYQVENDASSLTWETGVITPDSSYQCTYRLNYLKPGVKYEIEVQLKWGEKSYGSPMMNAGLGTTIDLGELKQK